MNKLWLIVLPAILFSYFPLKDQYFRKNFQFILDFQYGDYLMQKWFLVIVAFSIFFWWFFKRFNLKALLKEHRLQITLIALLLLVSHFFSYSRWFDFDDFRVIGTHYDVVGTKNDEQMGLGNSMYYAIGMVYMVVRWFDRNFEVYNTYGILMYFFAALAIYAFTNKVLNNKTIATLAAIFFITSPTYWRQTLMMQEQMGDGFGILLTSMAYYLLTVGFFPGSVIFAAAALEFGLSRTHYIGLPLLLVGLFFIKNTKFTKDRILALISFPLITILYIPVFREYPMESIDILDWINNIPIVIRIFDTVFGATIPHWAAYQIATLSKKLLPEYYYWTTPLVGFLLASSLAVTSFVVFKKKKIMAAKFIFIGALIMVVAAAFPTVRGIRLVQEVKPLTSQYFDYFPGPPTSYGVHATFGVMLVFIGLSQLIKRKLFLKIAVVLIALNAFTWLRTDWLWSKQIAEPQKAADRQLLNIIPEDGSVKVIYTPPPSAILSHYVSYFYQLYRIREPLYFTNDPEDFIKLIEKYKPLPERTYLLTMDIKDYSITDHSDKMRKVINSLDTKVLTSLTND